MSKPSVLGSMMFRTLGNLEQPVKGVGELIDCLRLADPDVQREITDRVAPSGDTAHDRVRRSWVWVSYAEEVLPKVAASWVLGGHVNDVSASNAVAQLGPSGFDAVLLRTDQVARTPVRKAAAADDALEQLYVWAIDEHLAPILYHVSKWSGVGLRSLWGSIASAVVWTTSVVSVRLGVDVPVVRLQRLLDGRPELSGKGTIVLEREGAGRGLVGLHRTTCCLWFRLDPGQLCRNCVLATRQDVLEGISVVTAEARESS